MINETSANTIIRVTDSLKKEDFDQVIETINYVKLCLILFVLIVIKIILIKTVKICKRVYVIHNERVIREHSTTSTQA